MIELFASAAVNVLLVSLVVGAGLPALFALGIKSMAYGVGGDAEVSHETGHPVGKIVGGLLFALVVAFILTGIAIVVASGLGMTVSFAHVFPTFAPKSH